VPPKMWVGETKILLVKWKIKFINRREDIIWRVGKGGRLKCQFWRTRMGNQWNWECQMGTILS